MFVMGYFENLQLQKLGLAPKTTGAKPKKPLKKISNKKAAEMKEAKTVNTDSELDKWFEERRKEMTGVCANCGGKTGKDDDKFYRHSIAHILPKRDSMFPSVATVNYNWVELCFWGNSCHSKYDSSWEAAAKMRIWPFVIHNVNILYPKLTSEEKARLPEVLIQEINPEKFNP